MKNVTLKSMTAALLVSLLSSLGWAAEPLPVVASFSILGDLVKVVGGTRVRVTTLVGSNQDAHAFEAKPADAKAIVQARLFVINGLGFEPWAQKLAQSAHYKGTTLIASQGVKVRTLPASKHTHAETDPHAWQDPRNVVQYVQNIAKSLSEADPAGANSYQENSKYYIQELIALDQLATQQFGALTPRQRQIITSHDAFGYLAARYQIRFLAPQGINPDSEPSAKGLAQFIRQIKRDKIKAVFVENMRNPKLLEQIARETGVTLGGKLYVDALSDPAEPGSTYLKMMHHNVTQLVAGMRLN